MKVKNAFPDKVRLLEKVGSPYLKDNPINDLDR